MNPHLWSKKSTHFMLITMISSLALLPGCLDWFGGEAHVIPSAQESGEESLDDGSKVLISIGGKAIVTEKSLDAEVKKMAKLSPDFKQALDIMGDRIKFMTADQLLLRHLISKYIEDKGHSKTAAYKEAYDAALVQAKDAVNQQYFMKDVAASVSERDIRSFYDKEKERLLISEGGNKTKGVKFDDDDKAREFLTKVKTLNGDIAKAAQADDALKDKVQDFGLVHAKSIGVDATLRDKIAGMKASALPMTDLLRVDDNTFWVVHVSEHEDKKYRDYSEVKDQIKQMLEEQSRGEAVEKKLESLKKKYGVTDNRDVTQDACAGLEIPELPEE